MRVLMIGTFPPPVHGVSTVNQLMFERLSAVGWDVEKINTSVTTLSSSGWRMRLSHAGRSFLAWRSLWKTLSGQRLVYLGLSGGWGQVYNLVTVLLSRLKNARCVLHYHSVACLEKKWLVTKLLLKAAGDDAIHVVLCEGMKAKLESKYGCQHVIVLSNLALLGSLSPHRDVRNLRTIGYLSNITKEKGGWAILELANAVRSEGLPLDVKVAGPSRDPELGRALSEAHKQGALEWLGPVYAGTKTDFWDSIDLFVFPTFYEHEAEPLVVWEALSAGIPVIAHDRGCIAYQVGAAGQVIDRDTPFVEKAISILKAYLSVPETYTACSSQAATQCECARAKAETQWERFRDALADAAAGVR